MKINEKNVAFIFDTGANLSVVTHSLARSLGLEILEASVDVVAIAGNKVKAKLGIAKTLNIGLTNFQHVVFLVFDDRDLYVEEARFQIHGLIGFPVIAPLKEVTLTASNEIVIPVVPTSSGEQNLALEGLSPLIAGWYEGQRLIFAFDTGADKSTLFPPFYKKFEDAIKAKYKEHTDRVRGVGEYKEVRGFLGANIVMMFSGKTARFEQIPIHSEHTNDKSRHFYGNIGQDLVKQFQIDPNSKREADALAEPVKKK